MTSHLFCPHHLDNIRHHEASAYSSWQNLMHRAVTAYDACRHDNATLYFESALELALVRACCESNSIFNVEHLAKPLEFMIALYLAEQKFGDAIALLSRISSKSDGLANQRNSECTKLLAKHYEHVEIHEKQYYIEQSYH
jgi:hypothetical protein